jgi:hypothetical protein
VRGSSTRCPPALGRLSAPTTMWLPLVRTDGLRRARHGVDSDSVDRQVVAHGKRGHEQQKRLVALGEEHTVVRPARPGSSAPRVTIPSSASSGSDGRRCIHAASSAPCPAVGTVNQASVNARSPTRSASATTGTRPAADTRFGSSKRADDGETYGRVSLVGCLRRGPILTFSGQIIPPRKGILPLRRDQTTKIIGGSGISDRSTGVCRSSR